MPHRRSFLSSPGQQPSARLPTARRLFHGMRTEGAGAGREAAALGLGVFIGCTPLYGFHLALVVFAGWLFRLNRLKMYIAANVSNPFFAPVLIFVEIQLGAWLQRRQFHSLTPEAIRSTDPWAFGVDLLLGSVVLGLAAGLAVGTVTYVTSRRDDGFEAVAAAAADRYLRGGIVAWEFARGKLRGDPVYREAVTGRLLRSGRTLVDIGCGQGLTLAVLAEARMRVTAGQWPASLPEPPLFEHLIGIELRPRVAKLAASALGSEATIQVGDAAVLEYPPASAVLLFDVLHMMPLPAQETLLRTIEERLEPGGVLLVREANAAAGAAFQFVRLGNALKAFVQGNWGQRFAFRTTHEWDGVFRATGFVAEARDMARGTPFANVLFTLRRARDQRS